MMKEVGFILLKEDRGVDGVYLPYSFMTFQAAWSESIQTPFLKFYQQLFAELDKSYPLDISIFLQVSRKFCNITS